MRPRRGGRKPGNYSRKSKDPEVGKSQGPSPEKKRAHESLSASWGSKLSNVRTPERKKARKRKCQVGKGKPRGEKLLRRETSSMTGAKLENNQKREERAERGKKEKRAKRVLGGGGKAKGKKKFLQAAGHWEREE